jgi:hypothetical protein
MRGIKTTVLLATMALALAAGAARAQEPAEDEDAQAQAPRHTIRVLENPYDIASFYRSHQADYFGYQPPAPGGPYAIASFYRQNYGTGYGSSPFWTGGYGASTRSGLGMAYRRRIGDNGDLYLIAPFLAHVGPLSGVFLGGR